MADYKLSSYDFKRVLSIFEKEALIKQYENGFTSFQFEGFSISFNREIADIYIYKVDKELAKKAAFAYKKILESFINGYPILKEVADLHFAFEKKRLKSFGVRWEVDLPNSLIGEMYINIKNSRIYIFLRNIEIDFSKHLNFAIKCFNLLKLPDIEEEKVLITKSIKNETIHFYPESVIEEMERKINIRNFILRSFFDSKLL